MITARGGPKLAHSELLDEHPLESMGTPGEALRISPESLRRCDVRSLLFVAQVAANAQTMRIDALMDACDGAEEAMRSRLGAIRRVGHG